MDTRVLPFILYFHAYVHILQLTSALVHLLFQNIRKQAVAQDFFTVLYILTYTSNGPVPITGFNINTRNMSFMTHHLVEVVLSESFCK